MCNINIKWDNMDAWSIFFFFFHLCFRQQIYLKLVLRCQKSSTDNILFIYWCRKFCGRIEFNNDWNWPYIWIQSGNELVPRRQCTQRWLILSKIDVLRKLEYSPWPAAEGGREERTHSWIRIFLWMNSMWIEFLLYFSLLFLIDIIHNGFCWLRTGNGYGTSPSNTPIDVGRFLFSYFFLLIRSSIRPWDWVPC